MKHEKRTVDIDVWIADDGTSYHHSEAECLRYEQDRADLKILDKLHKMKLSVPVLRNRGMVGEEFYFVRNKEERDAIYRKWTKRSQWNYVNNNSEAKTTDIKLGDWVVRRYMQDDDDRYFAGVYTLSWLVDEFAAFLDEVNEITVEGKF